MEELKIFEKKINEQIYLYNLEFKKHFFNHESNKSNNEYYNFFSFDDNELYNFSKSFEDNLKLCHIYKKLNNCNNINDILKFSSFDCRHLFHDDKWIKFTKNNFICDIEDDYKEIYFNSINKSDMKSKQFLDFVANIEKCGYNIKYLNFDDSTEDAYNNDSLMWIILSIETGEILNTR